jgi:hypothetical protein
MVLRLIRDLPGAPGFLATVTRVMPKESSKHHREFDTSVGVSGPHDFAVRYPASRLRSFWWSIILSEKPLRTFPDHARTH